MLRPASWTPTAETDGTIDNTASTFSVYGLSISSLTDSTADLATLDSYIKGADAAIKEMTTAAAGLGAVKSRIGLQQDFVKNLMNALERGIGALVDADMNEKSTKLQALQVKQQLGIQTSVLPTGKAKTSCVCSSNSGFVRSSLCWPRPARAWPILFRCLLQGWPKAA